MFDDIRVTNDWHEFFEVELQKPYMQELQSFLLSELSSGKAVFPDKKDIFKSYELTSLEDLRVVILGQDPYPTPGFANGLSFSVNEGVQIPASLKNIFKELERDLGITPPASGNLQAWAEQGVMLLNTILTVVSQSPMEHEKRGWEQFTQATIEAINALDHQVVFLAWGGLAHDVCELVDETKHLVIRTSHPSNQGGAYKKTGTTKSGKPYSSFAGSNCFSAVNEILSGEGGRTIDWTL